jgi:hypothetical protein
MPGSYFLGLLATAPFSFVLNSLDAGMIKGVAKYDTPILSAHHR